MRGGTRASASSLPEYPKIPLGWTILFNALFVVWWLEFGLRYPVLGAIRLEFILAALLTGVAVLRASAGSSAPRSAVPEDKNGNSSIVFWACACVIVQLVSIPLAADTAVAWKSYVDNFLKLAILGALIGHFVVSPQTLMSFLGANLLAFMKIGQEAFVGKITGSMVWENQGIPRLWGTVGSMFGHPNSLSGKTISALAFVFYLFGSVNKRWAKIALIVFLVFAANIVIFTGSRTGYLGIIAQAFFILMLSKRKARALTVLVAAAVATVILVPPAYKDRFLSSFTGQEAEGRSADTRKGLFNDSIAVFRDNPLGVGLSCFPIVQARNGRNAQETHNLYTQLLAETGVQGTICFIGLFVAVLRRAFAVRRRLAEQREKLEGSLAATPMLASVLGPEIAVLQMLHAALTAVAVFLLTRLALGVFGHDLLEIYWWFAAGLVAAIGNIAAVAAARGDYLVAGAGSESRAREAAPAAVGPA